MSDTIFARASGSGRAAVAVLRLSGPASLSMLEALAGPAPIARRAALRRLRDPITGELLDRGIVLWLPGPGSYTGEDCVELQLHGGVSVVEALSESLMALGARLAEPGEFTRRAFQNERLDLTEAEAVADLIDAETSAQRRQALDQISGGLTWTAATWRDGLIEALAVLEAAVDFPEEDLPDQIVQKCREPLYRLLNAISSAATDPRGERVRLGLRVALVGRPNAGKSTLFNALIERDASIVSSTPGTTRDVIEASVVLDGQKIVFADMAGLTEATHDPIELEGIRRARSWSETADLRLHVRVVGVDGSDAPAVALGQTGEDWIIYTKADLLTPASSSPNGRVVSALHGQGMGALRQAIAEFSLGRASREPMVATRARHRSVFQRTAICLARAIEGLDKNSSPELVAEDVRLAARALAALSGRVDAEDVLGRVFATFCIGK